MTPDLVLIIDTDDVERRRLRRTYGFAGFSVVEAASGIEGLFELLETEPDLVLLAEEVPPLEAADLLTIVRRLTDAPVVVGGGGGEPEEVKGLDEGADFYLRRPVAQAALLARTRALLRRYRRWPGVRSSNESKPLVSSSSQTAASAWRLYPAWDTG